MSWGRRRKDSKAVERAKSASLADVEAKAMMLLAMRDHGTQELRSKLEERQYPKELIEQVLERFTQYNYLDDERTASRAAMMFARQCWGPSQIRAKMRARGYQSDEIDAAINEIDEEERWIESARERLASKFHKTPDELDENERVKAWRHLAYRGFNGGVIKKAMTRTAS